MAVTYAAPTSGWAGFLKTGLQVHFDDRLRLAYLFWYNYQFLIEKWFLEPTAEKWINVQTES